jgi:hypothetical protein
MSNTTRPIEEKEKQLIIHLLTLAKAENLIGKIPDAVSPYNLQQPESINLSGTDAENYAGDIITVEYFDEDKIRVIISLTKDKEGNLLDMDFWKEDFVNLINYPTPDKVEFIK